LGFLIGLVLTVPVRAADWPKQPVTVVVPFGAGGNTDTMARMVSQRLQERLGQPFLVDNRGGAGGAGTGRWIHAGVRSVAANSDRAVAAAGQLRPDQKLRSDQRVWRWSIR